MRGKAGKTVRVSSQSKSAPGGARRTADCTAIFYVVRDCDRAVELIEKKGVVMSNSHDETVRFYVVDGPLASSVSGCDESYFREGLHADHGGVRVLLADGTTELVAGSRYLEPGTRIRADVVGVRLQVIYLGEVLREYTQWVDYSDQIGP